MAGALALGLWGRKVMVRGGTAVNPAHSTTALVVTGPFRFTRNPLYISLTLLYIGIAVSANALWILALVPVPVWIVTVGVIRREERYLEREVRGRVPEIQGASAAVVLGVLSPRASRVPGKGREDRKSG